MFSYQSSKQHASICWNKTHFYLLFARSIANETAVLTCESRAWTKGFCADEIVRLIRENMRTLRIRKVSLRIALGRSQVETFALDIPSSAETDIAKIVQNEISLRFPEITEPTFDFRQNVPSLEAKTSIAVLRMETAKELAALKKAFGQKPCAIHLRSDCLATAARRQSKSESDLLVVGRIGNSVDLVVTSDGLVVFDRTVQIDDNDQPEQLAREILRTVAATPEAVTVGQVMITAEPPDDQMLIDKLSDQLPQIVSSWESTGKQKPFGVDCEFPTAALLGLIECHSEIEFANAFPQRSSSRPWKRIAIYSIAGALILGFLSWTCYENLGDARRQAAEVESELKEAQKLFRKLAEKTATVDAIDRWEDRNVIWLDEIQGISQQFPQVNDATIERLNCSPSRGADGAVSMTVRVRDPAVLDQLEEGLRNNFRRVTSKRLSQSNAEDGYPWRFETSLMVTRSDSVADSTGESDNPANGSDNEVTTEIQQ